MNSVRTMHGIGDGLAALWRGLTRGRGLSRGAAWGLMIVGALAAFEVFNFSTTEFALRDVLGDLAFAGMLWSHPGHRLLRHGLRRHRPHVHARARPG